MWFSFSFHFSPLRPAYVAKINGSLSLAECQRYAGLNVVVPDSLSFDNMMEGKTLPPMSIQDFMNYFVYISRDAENLQFYLWYQDYKKKFDALPEFAKALSPRWKPGPSASMLHRAPAIKAPQTRTNAMQLKDMTTLGLTDLGTFLSDGPSSPTSILGRAPSAGGPLPEQDLTTPGASADSGLKWEAFSIQPLRHEITLMTANYLHHHSDRELNLSAQDRARLLHTLQHTTHPSAFDPILDLILPTLRLQSQPNFIRWSICNGNKPRVFALRSLGMSVMTLSFIGALLLILSGLSRWWRLFLVASFYLGAVSLIASYKGLCVLLYRYKNRQLRPWEIDGPAAPATPSVSAVTPWETDADTTARFPTLLRSATTTEFGPSPPSAAPYFTTPTSFRTLSIPPTPTTASHDPESAPASLSTAAARLLPLGPQNNFSHEPWVARWKRRNAVRKVFAQTTLIKDEGLRVMQRRIVLQAVLYGALVTLPLVVAVVALPRAGLY